MKNLALSRNKKCFHGLFKGIMISVGLWVLAFIGIIIVVGGVLDNNGLVKQTTQFIAKEKSRKKLYSELGKHDQYLFDGFKVLYVPPSLNLLFDINRKNISLRVSLGKEPVWKKVERNIILFRKNFIPPAIAFMLMGMIFMLYSGLFSYKRVHRLVNRFGKAIPRMIVLDLCIGLILVSIYYAARLVGLDISSEDGILGSYFVLYSLVLLNLCFAIGFFMGLCLKDKKIAMAIGVFICFVMIFIAPQLFFRSIYKDFFNAGGKSFENMDIKRFGDNFKYINAVTMGTGEKKNKKGKTFEKSLTKEWMENIKSQNKAIEKIKKQYYSYENQVMLVPSNFWVYLVNELTGRGITGHLNFLDHGLKIKEDLVKKYKPEDTFISISNKKHKGLEKDDLYLYKDKGRIPGSFYKATLFTIYYTIILFLVSLLIALRQRRLRIKKNEKNMDVLITNAKNYFYSSLSVGSSRVYIVLEQDLAGVDTVFSSELLYMAINHLQSLFSRFKIRDFWSFYSADPEKMAEFFDEKEELWEKGEESPTADELWSEEWFSPTEGLVTVRALIEAINNNPDVFRNRPNLNIAEIITAALRNMERTLSTAEAHGVHWHLEVDFHKDKEKGW